jgi:hypothetical protein
MKTRWAEWLWRLAVLLALGWIGLQLQQLHEDITQPVADDQSTVAAADDTQDSLDAIRDDLGKLNKKVDAILVVMARAK